MIVLDQNLVCPLLLSLLLFFISALFVAKILNCVIFAPFSKMDRKTVIITGGNGGIGKETAKEIAKRGARVILACRNMETAKKARDEIVEETNNQDVVVKKLDLSSQKSIREFAEDVLKNESRLDVLIHNAGIAADKVTKNEDGLEMTMATNHFGPFLLTHLLIDLLKRSAPSRIVVVASELYRLVSLDLNNINPSSSCFPPRLYYVSKYANILFARELSRRLEGTRVTANSLHPGLVNTGIWESAPAAFRWAVRLVVRACFKTPKQGCQTSVYLASSEEVEGVSGKYFSNCREKGLSRGARDDQKAKRLWELSEGLVQLKPNDPKI